jgi:hypothetical protein
MCWSSIVAAALVANPTRLQFNGLLHKSKVSVNTFRGRRKKNPFSFPDLTTMRIVWASIQYSTGVAECWGGSTDVAARGARSSDDFFVF